MPIYKVPIRVEIDTEVTVEANSRAKAMTEAEKSGANAYPEGYVEAFNDVEKIKD